MTRYVSNETESGGSNSSLRKPRKLTKSWIERNSAAENESKKQAELR